MASSTTKTDAADEAGGETIFSSDGMPPLGTPQVPPTVVSKDKKDSSVFDSQDWSVTADNDDSLLDTANSSTLAHPFYREESPTRRLERLQREVQELKKQEENQEQVEQLARDLAERLQISASLGSSAQQELLKTLYERLEQRNEQQQAEEETTGGGDKGGIVYELYGGSTMLTTTANAFSSLEERLQQMERLVGASAATATTTTTTTSLVQRLEKVETMAKRVDEKALDEAATRAKVIRADLEAASKARAKLGSSSSITTTTLSAKDSKMISDLYNQLEQLHGLGGVAAGGSQQTGTSNCLPALANRLQQLASLHAQGATFANRLNAMEQAVPQLQASIQDLQSTLVQVEEGMVRNLETVQANMKVLGQGNQ